MHVILPVVISWGGSRQIRAYPIRTTCVAVQRMAWRTRERIQMHGCGRRGKKAGGNHDQARIWASKVRVRTQLRTRNAITRVSKSPSRSGRPFLACPPPPLPPAPSMHRGTCAKSLSIRGHVCTAIAKSWTFPPFVGASLKRRCYIVVRKM